MLLPAGACLSHEPLWVLLSPCRYPRVHPGAPRCAGAFSNQDACTLRAARPWRWWRGPHGLWRPPLGPEDARAAVLRTGCVGATLPYQLISCYEKHALLQTLRHVMLPGSYAVTLLY